MTDDLLIALRAAVGAAPDHLALRLELAGELLTRGEPEEALLHARAVLARAPAEHRALGVAERACRGLGDDRAADGYATLRAALGAASAPAAGGPAEAADGLVVEGSDVRLADVGGLADVKEQLEQTFFGPLRNPEVRDYYGLSVGGGLLMYGPPGCGKTYLARAVAGELDAQFLAIGLPDVLDMWLGESERKLHEAFELARRNAPCVMFIDEVDALGQRRSNLRMSAQRTVVNQLLQELDGVNANNAGVFVLAATNQPWDVDPALRRPGRLDRTLLVLPPDLAAREAIFIGELRRTKADAVDAGGLAKRTSGLSGADIALVCRAAAAAAMTDAVRTGVTRPIGQADLELALKSIRPSTSSWFRTAYSYASFQNDDGEYTELLDYIRRRKLDR